MCFEELTYVFSGNLCRVVARVNKDINFIGGFLFGGDVIINLDNIPEEYISKLDIADKYCNCNLGILPQQGNLQGGKKKAGNDWRLDIFLRKIKKYYLHNDKSILKLTKNRQNESITEAVLNFLGCKIIDGKIEETTNNDEKIYNFCDNLYGLNRDMVNRFLNCNVDAVDEYCSLLNDFWKCREIK